MDFKIRDAVHNFITVGQKERELIGTRAFQRLRGIRQLALANLVYPGALHTRFDHSLGVMHVAGQLAEAIKIPKEDAELIRYAALLHDIGHGPFSHVSENALDLYADRSKLKGDQKKEKIHELVTMLLIQTDPEIRDILAKSDRERVVALLGEGYGAPVNRALVSGPLDADKQDYLLRDSYFCGVKYGVFDLHQLHRSLTKANGFLMVRDDGIHALEQYMLAKYYLTTNVYRHKVRLITDQMITRAIVLGIERDNIEELRALYTFDNTRRFVENYSQWDDHRFMQTFGASGQYRKTKCQNMLRRLHERRLFKRIYQISVSAFSTAAREFLRKVTKPGNGARRSALERAVAQIIQKKCGVHVDADYVIMHVFNIKSVKEMARNDEAGVLIDTGSVPVSFEQKSSLFASIQGGYDPEFVEIYAPVGWNDREERQRFCNKLKEPLMEVIEQHGAAPMETGP